MATNLAGSHQRGLAELSQIVTVGELVRDCLDKRLGTRLGDASRSDQRSLLQEAR